jgi:hypothetical protein
MKILMTGLTARSVNSNRLKYDYLTFCFILRDALIELGHTVEMRTTEIAESLSGYDKILVCASLMSSLSSRHVHRVGDVLVRYPEKVTLYFDDWSVEKLGYDTGMITTRHWERHTKEFRKNEYSIISTGWIEKIRQAYMRLIDPAGCPWQVIAPMFPWGDHQRLMRDNVKAELIALDPSGMVKVPEFSAKYPTRRWIMASLSDHASFLKKNAPRWPVTQLGNKRQDQPVVDEAAVVQSYAESWGVLSPAYQKAGCGWWRARYNFAAATKSIVFCGSADGSQIGEPYNKSVWSIEGRSDEDLTKLAQEQYECFTSQTWSREKFLKELANAL